LTPPTSRQSDSSMVTFILPICVRATLSTLIGSNVALA
jgi:hypothetical protein